MKLQKINLGKVGITVEYDYWDYNKSYDKLTVVQDHNHNTYLSRKPVPKENNLDNRNYWIPVIQNVSLSELYDDLDIIRQSLTDFKNEHQTDINRIISTLVEHGNSIEGIIQAITEIQTVLAEYATISYVDNTIINNVNSLKQFISENYIDNVELQSSINSINQNIQNVENRLQQDIDYKINETNDALNKEIKAIKGDEYNTLLKLPTLSNLAIDLQNNQLENNNKFNILDNTILTINKNVTTINNELIVAKNTINSLETEINKSVINVTKGYNNGTILVKTRNKEEEIQIPGLTKFAFAESITAEEVGADIKGSANNALLEAKQHSYELTTKEVADRNTAISEHNLSTTSHPDIRNLIQTLNDKVTAVLNSTDEDLDTFKELVDYIKDNRDLLAGKVNITDIVNNLTTNIANKPLSAAQGVILKSYINDLESLIDAKADNDDLVEHINDDIKHITSDERSKWNEAYDKIWDPSNKTILEDTTASYMVDEKNKLMTVEAGAEVNQKAYSSILIESPNQSSEIISAINKTDQLILSGSVNTSLKIEDGKIVIESKDTTYNVATNTLGGLMSAADKIALDTLNNSNVSSITSTAKWGDSLTVNIKGVEKTLTIPNKPTLADLTNNLISLGNINAGDLNQPIYFKNGVPTSTNVLQTNVYNTILDYPTDGWEEIKGKMHGNRLAITKYRNEIPVFVDRTYDTILSFGNADVLSFISTSWNKARCVLNVGGGLNADNSPWYWKLKGTDTATYTLPTKTSTLASIDDVPTKLSELEDDIIEGNYLPMAKSTYDTTDTTNVLKHDGSWGIPELAEDLGGREETHHEEFFFQPTAGNDLSIKDGYAKIKSLKGNTIIWNQWVPLSSNKKSPSITHGELLNVEYTNDCTTLTFNNYSDNIYFLFRLANVYTYTNIYKNHKYYISYKIKNESDINIGFRVSGMAYADCLILQSSMTEFQTYSTIVTANPYTEIGSVLSTKPIIPANYEGQKILIKSAIIIDLTQMFGEGNEPTIEEFEAMYPDDYYEYNEGELRSFNGSAIKSVGFNQFNANSNEIIKHSVILADGSLDIRNETSTITNYSTLNNIKIFPNTTYYVHNIPDGYAQRAIALYDINKIFTRLIGVYHGNNNNHSIDGKTSFTTLENEHYCTLGFMDYNKQNVCLNLSHSGYRNGQYEPYKESRLQLPIKTIKDDNGNLLFPNGLRSAGTAYDEIVYDEALGKYKAIKRISSVDMGTLNGQYYSVSESYPYGYFAYYNFSNRKKGNNVLCIKYSTYNQETFEKDKKLLGSTNHNTIYIIDSTYTDFATFKQSLQGQILYYELETPIEVILDNIDLSYEAWDFGTEELLSDVATTPIITETQYNFNAVDMIRNNYFAIKALKEADPLNDLADVAFSGNYNDLENKPESIKNPTALTITKGNINTVYDGSEVKNVSIPTKTSELTKDDVYTKTEVYTQSEVNSLINSIEGVVGGIVDTWRPLSIQNSSGTNILSLGGGNTSGALTLKAGNNIIFNNNNGIITIGSTYTYSLPAASTTLGGIKTGGDLILTDGIATVNDLSTISNNASRGLEAYNWGNHDGKYLPLSGGILNGNLIVSGDNSTIIRNVKFNISCGWARGICSLQVDGVTKFTIGGYGLYATGATDNDITYVYIGCNSWDKLNLRITPTTLKWGDATILHAYNYTSYINETKFPGINKTGTYNKPTAGIPKSDLDLSVQTSLGKADTALQSYTEQYTGTVTGIQMNGGTFAPTDGIVNLGTVITAHQSLAAYAKLASPTFTGTPKAPTATAGTNNTQIATTAFVKTAIDNKTSITYATEAGKVTKALKFGTKTYNGSSEQTITAADLGLEAALKYCGITTTQLYDGSTANPIIIDNKNHTAVAGCTVFYNSKEFVFNGSKWEEIGDESSFKVKQTAVSSPTASGSATAFIDTISQDTNGNITVTKKNVSFPTIPTSFNIEVNLTDDNIVNLTGNGGPNNVTIAATHAEKGPSAGYTSSNTTTSVSGYGDSKTIKIPQITVDKYGHVTAAVDESVTITMPSAQTIPTLSGGVAAGINKVLSGITVNGHTITPTQKTLKGTGKVSVTDDGNVITIYGSGDTYTGTVTSITTGTGLLGGTITASGTISLATVGNIAGSFGLSANTTPGYSGTFKVPYITVDNYGRVTAISEKTVTMPSAQANPTYGLGYPGTPGLAEPAGFTTDTGFALNNHKNCYHAVQINGEGKLVVNIPKVYTVVREIPTITIGEKSRIVYTPSTTSMTIKLNSSSRNSYTHLYVINNLNASITITFNAKNIVGPTAITSSSSSGISVDLYVTDDGTIVIEPYNDTYIK